MTSSPYAVPLDALVDAAMVSAAEQVTVQSAPRLQHLPGEAALWSPDGLAVRDGGSGGCGDGDC